MYQSRFRGGADYNLNDILGPKFEQYVGLLRGANGDLRKFTDKVLNAGNVSGSGVKPDDIPYSFTEAEIAFTEAFKQIEQPDIRKAALAENFAGDIYGAYDVLSSEKATGISGLPTSLNFEQLPYNNRMGGYLVPGFHLLKYNAQSFQRTDTTAHAALQNAVRYLYHFIALFDSNVPAEQIMLLAQEDHLYFMKYAQEIAQQIMSDTYFAKGVNLPADAGATILQGVVNGLKAIAVRIINEYRSINVGNSQLPATYRTIPNALDAAGLSKYLKTIGNPTDADAIAAQVKALDDLLPFPNAKQVANSKQVAIDAAVPEQTEREEYRINGHLNNIYLDETKVSKSITAAGVGVGGVQGNQGGVNLMLKNLGGPGGDPSLRFLYGPPLSGGNVPLGNVNLITNPVQAAQTEAALADKNVAQAVYELANTLPTHAPNQYPLWAAVMAIANKMIVDNEKMGTLDSAELVRDIGKALTGLASFNPRIQSIPTDLSTKLNSFKDDFVSEFVRTSVRGLRLDDPNNPGKVVSIAQPYVLPGQPTKPNLSNDKIWDFYTKTVVPKASFYKDFFNLVLYDQSGTSVADGNVDLKQAASDEANRGLYRLNVRKVIGESRLPHLMYGGADQFGDLIFISLLPDYPTDGSVAGIWLTSAIYLDPSTLTAQAEAIRNIARQVYNAPPPSNGIVNIYNKPVNIAEIMQRALYSDIFSSAGYNALLKNYLTTLASTDAVLGSTWKEGEKAMSEHMLREGNRWERVDNEFVLMGKDGKPEAHSNKDDCAFFDVNTQECVDFFSQCLLANDVQSRQTQCGRLLTMKFKFDVNPGAATLKKEIQALDPALAFAILQKFGFSSHMVDNDSYPFYGFRRLKVQSVGSWLEALIKEKNSAECKPPVAPTGGKCGTIHDQIGNLADQIIAMAADSSNNNFFNYLDVLVNWVNANPQALNPEMVINPTFTGNYPPISKLYKTYTHVNPYRPIDAQLYDTSCGLQRLKASIINDLSGAKAGTMMSDIAGIPTDLQFSLNRNAWTTPYPFGNLGAFGIMQSGGFFTTAFEVDKIHEPQGYKLFTDIYKDIERTMTGMTGTTRTELTKSTRDKINNKLESFRVAEEALRTSLSDYEKKKRIWEGTRGNANPFTDYFPYVADKHSNLLNVSSTYNRRAVNLIDIFQAISQALLGKVQETNGKPVGYYRPMTMGYNYKNQ
ncbi:Hypothetical protein MVR_LOCUS94 [uncultured virus]|nr:Hypothetical protein MVR_LOCUS94 [uncultured virus]